MRISGKLFPILTGMIVLGFACTNDIDLIEPGDPLPVVYCILNPDVNEQFVRLGRTYLVDPSDPDAPPVMDSTVWEVPVSVYIEEWMDGAPVNRFDFNPTIAPPKDSGFFPIDNLRLFKVDFMPTRLAEYHIYVHFTDDSRIVTGAIKIPDQPGVIDPLDIPGRKINLQPGVQLTARWSPGESRGIFQSRFIIQYTETIAGQMSVNQFILKKDPVLGLGASIEMTDIYSGNRFMKAVLEQVPVKPGAERNIIQVQFLLHKSGEEMALQTSPYLQQTTISNTLNEYTNLINGIGLFSSIQIVTVNNLVLSNTTLNELARNELTDALGFRDIYGNDPQMAQHE